METNVSVLWFPVSADCCWHTHIHTHVCACMHTHTQYRQISWQNWNNLSCLPVSLMDEWENTIFSHSIASTAKTSKLPQLERTTFLCLLSIQGCYLEDKKWVFNSWPYSHGSHFQLKSHSSRKNLTQIYSSKAFVDSSVIRSAMRTAKVSISVKKIIIFLSICDTRDIFLWFLQKFFLSVSVSIQKLDDTKLWIYNSGALRTSLRSWKICYLEFIAGYAWLYLNCCSNSLKIG